MSAYNDCFAKGAKYGYKEDHIVDLLIVLLIIQSFLIVVYLTEPITGISFSVIGIDLFSALCWTMPLVLFGVVIAYTKFVLPNPSDKVMVDCISSYYSPSDNMVRFENFKWLVDARAAILIEYEWICWLVIPHDENLYLLANCNSQYEDIYIARKFTSWITTIYRREGMLNRKLSGATVLFQIMLCTSSEEYDEKFRNSLKKYKGVCHICTSDETCSMARMLIDGMRKNVCGISVGQLYSYRYLGLCVKTPRSREEFEETLSYAVDLYHTLSCEEEKTGVIIHQPSPSAAPQSPCP